MKIKKITILSGVDKKGNKENFTKLEIVSGQKIGIVGPTGSGKSQLLYDIERLAQGNTKTKREILINDKKPPAEFRHDASKKIIGYLTQHMNFLTDASVKDFLELHLDARGKSHKKHLVDEIIESANKVTGEPIMPEANLLVLSGGQSRALMVADLAYISESPIILIDEIENAGIRKEKALELLSEKGKIVFLVTHDPRLALNTDKRLVMKSGAINQIIHTSIKERGIAHYLSWIEEYILEVREDIRIGKRIEELKLICTPM
jgi:ABC-type lipoprotein export system ATPase subunit